MLNRGSSACCCRYRYAPRRVGSHPHARGKELEGQTEARSVRVERDPKARNYGWHRSFHYNAARASEFEAAQVMKGWPRYKRLTEGSRSRRRGTDPPSDSGNDATPASLQDTEQRSPVRSIASSSGSCLAMPMASTVPLSLVRLRAESICARSCQATPRYQNSLWRQAFVPGRRFARWPCGRNWCADDAHTFIRHSTQIEYLDTGVLSHRNRRWI